MKEDFNKLYNKMLSQYEGGLSNTSNKKFDEIKFFQIDDGWQKSVGVWEVDEKKFPKGLQVITQRCVELGKSPGLWLAPYIVEEKSSPMIDHPDWPLS